MLGSLDTKKILFISYLLTPFFIQAMGNDEKPQPKHTKFSEKKEHTKHIESLLLKKTEKAVEEIKEYFLNNMDLLSHKSFVTGLGYYNAACCTPLYFFAVMKDNCDMSRWLLDQGARPKGAFELYLIAKKIIECDKNFKNSPLIKFLKIRKHVITEKKIYAYIENTTLIEIAKKCENNEAVEVLESILDSKI